MQNVALGDQNEWVAGLFQQVLDFIQELEFTRQSPSIFLVYAHESGTGPTADAKVAQQVIRWLNELGAHLYSDRSPDGNYHLEPRESAFDAKRVEDILSSQLCLLPKGSLSSANTVDTVDSVILCGSELLGEYLESDYYRDTYSLGIEWAHETMPPEGTNQLSALSNYVNTQVKETQQGFHHVLTELAFLELRVRSAPRGHRVVPLLLNGRYETSFPKWVRDSTVIRIEDGVHRAPGHWNGQPTYQDEGLHLAFFKLLKRLWPEEAAAIQTIEEEVYQRGLQSLQQGQSSVYQSGLSMKRVIERFTKDDMIRWRAGSLEKLLQRERGSKLEVEQQLSAWYPSLSDASVTNRLAIQRISGYPLPMEHCYINLGVIEYQPKQNQDMEDKASNQLFYRLRSAEAVTNTQTSEPIALADLFKPRRLKNEVEGIPKRILIRGRAGIGKTTLAKKSMYDHIHHQHWTEHFNYVLWIRLRHLKGKPTNYSLKTLLYEEYFEGYSSKGHELAELLYEQLQKDPHKTLFMLDGWDEIVQEPSIDCLYTLVNHPAVIITSRPHGVSSKTFSNLDFELETIGFSEANVMAYLDHRKIVDDPNAATAIKAFIQQHPFVKELVNIPIQLDALCYSWELIQDRPQRVETMTGLYQVMIEQLWRKDIVRLRKEENGTALTKEAMQSIRRFTRLEPLVREEIVYVEALALKGLYENRIEFSCDDVDDLTEQLMKEHQLPLDLERNVTKLSCLQVEKAKGSYRAQNYQFLHLTFQEFFAAQSLAKAFTQRKSLAVLKGPPIKADEFIRQYKYDPRYEIVWWLVAGLLEGEQLVQFFGLLDEDPQDLIGIQHQYLVMHCLRESHDTLPKDQQESRLSHLSSWLHVEIMRAPNRASHLGRQEALPDILLVKLLMREDATARFKQTVASTLGERHSCSHRAVQALIRLLQDARPEVRQEAARALGEQSPLAPAGVEALIRLLEDTADGVREAAAIALGEQSPLVPQGVEALIRLLQDAAWDVRRAATEALGKQSPLAPEWVEALIPLLQDADAQVRQAATWALERQSPLAPEGVEALIPLLQDADAGVRWAASSALGKQSPLSPEGVEALIPLLQDADAGVRWAAARALGHQSPLSPEVVEVLIRLVQDADAEASWSAAWVLGQQSPLSPEGVEALIPLLQDADAEARRAAAWALGHQSLLAPVGVEALILLLQDADAGVRWAAARALGHQSPLSPEVVEVLIRLVQDADAQVRQAATWALERQSPLAPEWVEALIPLLQYADAGVRQAAAEVLGHQSPLSPEGVEALIPLLQDPDAEVREAGAKTLGEQSPLAREFVTALIPFLQYADAGVRQAAAEVLGHQSPLSPEGVEALIRLLQDPDAEVREAGAKTLGEQSPLVPQGVEALTPLLQDSYAEVRETAAWALGHQSPLAPERVQALIPLLRDSDALVRQEAASALGHHQSSLASEVVEALIPLLQDTDAQVRQAAAWALGKQSPLAPERVQALIPLLQDARPEVSESITRVLDHQHSWNVYRLLPTMHTSSLKAVYSQWILPHNFKQPAPLYLHSGQLHFYTPEGLETIFLNDQEETFRKTILEAQQAVGITEASRIKI